VEKTGTAILPLHYGHPPEKLFRRMKILSGHLCDLIIEKFGVEDFLIRLSDPFWFHSLSLAIGFDWNSSGTTTSTLAAMKEHFSQTDYGVKIIGGKGSKMSLISSEASSLQQTGFVSDTVKTDLLYKSKIVAKVDQRLLLDGYDLYLHFIIASSTGKWSIIQQGMNNMNRMARRYHWFYRGINDFINDNRSGISAIREEKDVVDLSTSKSSEHRDNIVSILKDNPARFKELERKPNQKTLFPSDNNRLLDMNIRVDWNHMRSIYERSPADFNELYTMKGVGTSTMRALSYLAEVIFGSQPSYKDPIKYSFALGGKDGIPKPVNYEDYDKCISFYSEVLSDYRTGNTESMKIAENLARNGFSFR
jgi:hypothetical protein